MGLLSASFFMKNTVITVFQQLNRLTIIYIELNH